MIYNKTFYIKTLGCKLNFSESCTISKQLIECGFVQKKDDHNAGIYIINTCSVTNNADKECQHFIRKINKTNPESLIIVIGCYAQLKPEEIINIKGVDLVLGASEKFNITDYIENIKQKNNPKIHSCEIEKVEDFKSSFSFDDRTRAFLKIQDGCDYNCSYCTIPMARGKSRSDSIESIIKNVELLSKNGIKEIVLTGINLGDYKYANKKFVDVIKTLNENTAIPRFRISSIEPNLLTEEIVYIVSKSSNFMPHFHIPLQSGSNKILGAMRRRYRKKLYEEKVHLIKKLIPHCSIGVDVITGFPDEQECDFNDTYNFLNALDISYLHVFTYSERNETQAVKLSNSVPMLVRQERNKILRNLSSQKRDLFKKKFIGTTRKILFERENENNMITGYTDNYIKVETLYKPELKNTIIEWRI